MPSPTPPTDPIPAARNSAPATPPSGVAATTPPRKHRGRRIVLGAVLVLLLLLVVGGFIVYLYLDSIVEKTVEKQATKSTNLKTELGGVSLSLFGGQLDLKELEIASPPGFTSPHLLTLGKADVDVSLGKLREDPVRINSITLDKPKLVIEHQNGTFNFKKAIDQMPQGDPVPEGESKPLKMIIETLSVKDAQVVLRPGLPNLPAEINIPVGSIEMKNIGTGEGNQNGAAVKDVVSQLVTALAAQANTSDMLPPELKAILSGDLSSVMNKLGPEAQKRVMAAIPGPAGQLLGKVVADPNALMKDPGKAIGGVIQDVTGGTGTGTTRPALPGGIDPGKAKEGIQGLLGGKKDEKKKDK
jgi:hypothetical protein